MRQGSDAYLKNKYMTEKEIQKILDDSKLIWWLDSGSLLGLVRDGKFLKQDHDIDIGIIYENEEIICKLITTLSSLGFRVVKFNYDGNLYKCKCVPESESVFNYILDIQFYKRCDKEWICPQMVFKNNLTLANRIRRFIIRLKKSNMADFDGNSMSTRIKRFISSFFIKGNLTLNYSDSLKSSFDELCSYYNT